MNGKCPNKAGAKEQRVLMCSLPPSRHHKSSKQGPSQPTEVDDELCVPVLWSKKPGIN